ncbi:MAG: DUF3568 family protein [Candidatus Omnitrophica bacterium]|nr:DUF3568 family protein [Candidatus Omnitrophota bacterium]
MKKIAYLMLLGVISMNLCGCLAIFGGVVAGAGTAVWLSGKLSQEFHASYQSTTDAAKAALQSFNYPIVKETQEANLTQLISKYSDGRQIWVDIHKIDDQNTNVEVRVGLTPDKKADSEIMDSIRRFLGKGLR